MSDDKRKVSTDALETLGTIIGPDEKRDAIHLAVIPMQARFTLSSGDHVNAKGEPFVPYVGIVDPFLGEDVRPGEWFWLVIYPRQITSLRHVWSHPAFPEEQVGLGYTSAPTKEYSEGWLRDWVERSECPSYEFLINVAGGETEEPSYYTGYLGEYALNVHGTDACGEIPDEVWTHVENVIGKKVPHRPTTFSCSC